MRNIVLVSLIFSLVIGCGKKERGTFTVQNDSSYEVKFCIGENYESKEYTVQSGQTKLIDWCQYVLFYPVSPKNIIRYKLNPNNAVITNMIPMCNYTVDNAICDSLDMLDGVLADGFIGDNSKKYILSDGFVSVDKIKIDRGKNNIKCFGKIKPSDVILFGKELTISQNDSDSGKEEKRRECETKGTTSFLHTIQTNSNGKKYFKKHEILLEIIDTPVNHYLYIKLR